MLLRKQSKVGNLKIWMENYFVIFSNYTLVTPKPNLVSLTRTSPWILDIIQTAVFSVSGFLVKILIDKNCLNVRTSYHIDIKLGPLSKLEKGNTRTS